MKILSSSTKLTEYVQSIDVISEPPGGILTGLGLSFQDISIQLKELKDEILSYPLTQDFLNNPYNQTTDSVEYLDLLWTRIANKWVNDTSNIPDGFGRRATFVTNGGFVFINVQTFNPPKSLNYACIFNKVKVNFIPSVTTTSPVTNLNMGSTAYYNPEDVDFSQIYDNGQSQIVGNTMILCGSTAMPSTDPNDLRPEKFIASTFEALELHTTRKEIIQAMTQEYGWASRYSSTDFAVNYYVATTITGNDGYMIFLRISYFVM